MIEENTNLSMDESLYAMTVFQECFQLQWIKEKLNHLETLNKWEDKQKESLYRRLRTCVFYLIQQVLSSSPNAFKQTKQSLNVKELVLGIIDKNTYDIYMKHLSDIQRLKNPSITMLTVVILDIENIV